MNTKLKQELAAVFDRKDGGLFLSNNNPSKHNPICAECRKACKEANFYGPIPYWHVGKDYETRKPKVAFVGKWIEVPSSNPSSSPQSLEQLMNQRSWNVWEPFEKNGNLRSRSPFWTFIERVSDRIYKDTHSAYKYAAITNLVKCFNSKRRSQPLIDNCLNKLKLFENELDVLNPCITIFMTGWFASDWVDAKLKELAGKDYKLHRKTSTAIASNGKSTYIWTWHPQGLNFKKLTEKVIDEIEVEARLLWK